MSTLTPEQLSTVCINAPELDSIDRPASVPRFGALEPLDFVVAMTGLVEGAGEVVGLGFEAGSAGTEGCVRVGCGLRGERAPRVTPRLLLDSSPIWCCWTAACAAAAMRNTQEKTHVRLLNGLCRS